MSKSEIDKIITKNWTSIEGICKSYIHKSKLPVDYDVIGEAYEMLIEAKEKIKTEKEVKSFFLRIVYTSTIWSQSKYQKKNNIRETLVDFEDWHNFEPLFEEHEDWEEEYSAIDSFLESCTLEEKLVYTLGSIGYETSTKLNKFTGIPRSTCYNLQREMKTKILNEYERRKNIRD
jgi:RNA polymerase sigma factor (sigma-70 family)